MNSALDWLEHCRPGSAEIKQRGSRQLQASIQPIKVSGAKARRYDVNVNQTASGLKVSETAVSKRLPNSCVERHINPDGTFCITYAEAAKITDEQSALSWWFQLEQYLLYQEYAEKHGVWPLHAGLSHGYAADIQLQMESIATEIGVLEEVKYAIFRRDGWLGREELAKTTRDGMRVLNKKLACPRGCRWVHDGRLPRTCRTEPCAPSCRKQHRRVVRADCRNRGHIESLILLERQRRSIENDMISDLSKKGYSCCGTMRNCPLREL